ncbi:hypothetical protein RFI_35238 [Reticulomyxa filosa]|uniref:Uncharacterized protein n=1 Tax=Reticulomyxa filosa TaxID=46433 RepID=X6LJQ8_RETFI|nr:hypothetical protein RFI_35238 [Reticulomyxa filosa]|eukprot:ETO02198.1 hypothetical protein RFI_35238 [Reticulomyxa filosa]
MIFLLKRKSFPFLEKTLLDITTVVLALLFKQPNKANFYNMKLALESFFINALLCKVQQLPKKKKNNQCVPKTTSFKKKMLSSRPKQIRLPIVVSPDIGNIQVGVVHLSSQSREDIHFFVVSFNLFSRITILKNKVNKISNGGEVEKLLFFGNIQWEKCLRKQRKTTCKCIHNQPSDICHVNLQQYLPLQQKYLDKVIISKHSRGGDRINKYNLFIFLRR